MTDPTLLSPTEGIIKWTTAGAVLCVAAVASTARHRLHTGRERSTGLAYGVVGAMVAACRGSRSYRAASSSRPMITRVPCTAGQESQRLRRSRPKRGWHRLAAAPS